MRKENRCKVESKLPSSFDLPPVTRQTLPLVCVGSAVPSTHIPHQTTFVFDFSLCVTSRYLSTLSVEATRRIHCLCKHSSLITMQKKTCLTELFYLTLLITALRPPDNALHYRRERVWHGSTETLGPILAEDICFNSANRFLNQNGALCSDYLSPKNSILLDETHQVLEYINSLGRYSQPASFRSSLFAYPMSRGLSDEIDHTTPQTVDEGTVFTSTLFDQLSDVASNNSIEHDSPLTDFDVSVTCTEG